MKKMPVSEVWQYLPDDVQFVSMDEDGTSWGYLNQPTLRMEVFRWCSTGEDILNITIKLDYGTDDWTKTLRERPVNISLGQFGEFWNDEHMDRYGYLDRIDRLFGESIYYPTGICVGWSHFKPIDPATLSKQRRTRWT